MFYSVQNYDLVDITGKRKRMSVSWRFFSLHIKWSGITLPNWFVIGFERVLCFWWHDFSFFLPRRLQFSAQQNWFCNLNWVVVVFFLFFFGVQQTKFSSKSFCFLPFCRRILHFLLDKLMSIHNKSICHFEVATLLVTITGSTANTKCDFNVHFCTVLRDNFHFMCYRWFEQNGFTENQICLFEFTIVNFETEAFFLWIHTQKCFSLYPCRLSLHTRWYNYTLQPSPNRQKKSSHTHWTWRTL